MNKLYFGDNLDVLRTKIKDESVDLIYLDPPFNSAANYNVLFRTPSGEDSEAQVEAFRDTWEWGSSARDAYDDVMAANGDVALVLSGLRKWLGENAMMAYIVMMSARLMELRRVLKPDGTIFLHCDPTASHYLKIMLDAIFGHENFRNEIVWRRSGRRSSMSKIFRRSHDVIFMYSKRDDYLFNMQYEEHDETLLKKYSQTDARGKYQLVPLMASGTRGGETGRPWRGFDPNERGKSGMHWLTTHEKLEAYVAQGLVAFPSKPDGTPRLKYYLDQNKGVPLSDFWDDIDLINSMGLESLGYPTQKPLALLERIISASRDDAIIFDPFCGCGTTIEAAERLKRQWIGIDVTHYAITLIEGRLRKIGVSKDDYDVVGRPTALGEARALAARDKYQFQWWASWRLGAQMYHEEKKGADRGIDGNIFFHNGPYGTGRIIISVKGGDNVGVQMVRDLRGVIEREEAEMGVLISLAEPTGPMQTEADASGFVRKSAHGKLPRIQILTIEEMLANHLPKLPPLPQPAQATPTARRRESPDQLELLLPFEGGAIRPSAGDFVDPRFDVRLVAAE
jgi:adenine specific DNA methylase Mod